MKLRKDVVCGSAITIAGIIIYVEATRSIGKLGYDVLDSPFFPKLAAVMLVLFGVALTVTSLLKPTEAKKIQVNNPKKVVYFITLLVLYSLLLHYIGFIFS
ncbi:MAG: tripartite tricarboxylate transporter TctB family protein, partial [Candidatus Lokiarchaeia archaeon]